MKRISINIPDEVFEALSEHVRALHRVARVDPDTGAITTEPIFRSVADYLAEILAVNIANVMRDRPTPQMMRLRAEIEERERLLAAMARPNISVDE